MPGVPAQPAVPAEPGPAGRTRPAEPAGPARRTVRLPFDRMAVPVARQTLVSDLAARDLPPEVIAEAESVVAELVGNAVRHASPLPDGSVRVHWQARDGVVEVEVSDGGGPTRPAARPQAQLATAGRGLRIVRSLAHEWGVVDGSATPSPGGRTVWASVGGPSRRRAW